MSAESQENIYSVATASHIAIETPQAVAWPVSEHLRVATSAGLNGVELWPQRFGPAFELRFNLLSDREKAGVTSVHQSFRGPVKSGLASLGLSPFLPEINDSLKGLEAIYEQVGDVPAVLYKEAVHANYVSGSSYSLKQIQTDPETAYAWGIQPSKDSAEAAGQYINSAFLRQFNGIVIDTTHIRRPSKSGQENPLSDWEKSIPVLLPYVKEIHVGAGRTDFQTEEESSAEILDLLNGGANDTEVVRMLRFIADKGWKGLIVLEFRPSSIKEEYGRKLFVSSQDLISAYGRIRETLYSIFDK